MAHLHGVMEHNLDWLFYLQGCRNNSITAVITLQHFQHRFKQQWKASWTSHYKIHYPTLAVTAGKARKVLQHPTKCSGGISKI